MDFGLTTYGLSFAAGGLSTLSPCVLPLVPILFGAAVTAHRLGPLALAAGLTLSFTLIGVFVASLGASLGLDPSLFRAIASVLLIAFGILLLSQRLQEGFAVAASVVSGAGQGLLARLTLDGLPGQFILGLLLGIVWSPCVGPTLGAAVTLASQGQDLPQVVLLMALFGLGAGLPLVVLGLVSRQAMMRIRDRLLAAGKFGKQAMGGLLLILGAAILSGADKLFEAWALRSAPQWLVSLTTSI
ncbi:MAG: cytochrome c biogenesis CcdA family protein [Gammaproteobacteria bacterium]|nr:cytochrome c biogenesis CcdA family protein [Gammaproteobacteria bacterium]MBU1654819.1 cytochrome c biogenesis CcdA family protein [Gammaproteobacteria bacterium]MBU1961086.1 cytochrome c biogenesis CcdA family protein [Gammaproteobacteria bacterium]